MIKDLLSRSGYEVNRRGRGLNCLGQTIALYDFVKPSVVLDVGANTGQFARELLSVYPNARIVSFEPLPDAYQKLKISAAAFSSWQVAPRVALGSAPRDTFINVSKNSVSSSIRQITPECESAAPETKIVSKEPVRIERLDVAATPFLNPSDRIFLKMDTQGFESEILDGAVGILNQVAALRLELSFSELYQGQALAPEVIRKAENTGFSLFGLVNGFRDQRSGRLLQADAFFIKA